MLDSLLQTISNLGIDTETINRAFSEIFHAVADGRSEVLSGLKSLFGGIASFFPQTSGGFSALAGALLGSILDLLGNAGASSVFHTITGA